MQAQVKYSPSVLSSRAVLFRLFTSSFVGNPRDNVLTAEVESSHNTEARRVSVRKKIMQGAELNAVLASLNEVRAVSEKLSAPWLDGGLRIVPAKNVLAAKVQIEEKIRAFYAKVDEFIAAYDDIISRDCVALNGTFRATDYPSKENLRARFSARLELFPVATDFRVDGIADSIREEWAAELERLTVARVNDAKRELIERMREKVANLAGKLAHMEQNEKSRLHTSTVESIAETCADVKAANFDGDATLDALADKVSAALGKLSADTLRDSSEARKEAKETAEQTLAAIREEMAGFMM